MQPNHVKSSGAGRAGVSLPERVARFIDQAALVKPRARLLVALSGGVDSMVLLHLLTDLAQKRGWVLLVAHFNHRLRGRASAADARFVAATARRLGWKCVTGQGDVKSLARREGISIEMAARKLRHEFLAQNAIRERARTVMLAHHADDQVETLLLRLLRGAGGGGLSGMELAGNSPSDSRVRLIRPLLAERKSVLEAFAVEQGIAFREDASNSDDAIPRNRLRRHILPVLEREFGAGMGKSLLQSLAIIGAEADHAEQAAREWLANPGLRRFDALPLALQRQCLRLQLLEHKVFPEFALIERLRQSSAPQTAAGGVPIECDLATGRLKLLTCPTTTFSRKRRSMVLSEPGDLEWGGLSIGWRFSGMRGRFRRPRPKASEEVLDADRVGAGIVLRHWRPGDRFQPIGMPVAVKVQDLFVNARIPAAGRRQLVVATTAKGEIFWVEGLRVAEQFKLTPATSTRLHWRWARAPE